MKKQMHCFWIWPKEGALEGSVYLLDLERLWTRARFWNGTKDLVKHPPPKKQITWYTFFFFFKKKLKFVDCECSLYKSEH